MTLPVIPGPFSGLQQAGQVIGESLAKKRAMSIEDEARARAALLTLGQLGILRSDALAGPEFAGTFAAANVPQPSAGAVKPDVEAEKGNKLMKLLASNDENSFVGRMLLGAPTEAMENEDALKAYIADFIQREVKSSPAVARSVAKTPKAEVAEKAEEVQLGALDAEQLGNQVKTDIRKSVLKRLPKEPGFARLADYAEIGALGVLVSEIQARHGNLTMNRQESIERMKGLLQINDFAAREYRERLNKWNAERAKFFDPTEMSIIDPRYGRAKTQEEKDAIQQERLQLHEQQNPKPSFDAILEEHLGTRGVGAAEFQAAMRDMLNLQKEAEAADVSGVQGGRGGTTAARTNVDKAVTGVLNGHLTIEQIDATTSLTPEEKAQVKKLVAAKKGAKP